MSFINGKNKFDYCVECGEELLPSNRKRTNPKSCYKCRGIDIMPNHALNKVAKEALNPNSDESDGGNVFEDDPRAIKYNDNEVGRVIKKSIGYVYSECAMADTIVDTKK